MTFKGEYKKTDPTGAPLKYFKGDSVLFQGKIYLNIEGTKKSPLESPNQWSYTGDNSVFISDNPPLNPVVGQIWATNGKYYSYYYDGNNYAWVEF